MRRTTRLTAMGAAGLAGLVLTGAALLPASAETAPDQTSTTSEPALADRLERLKEALSGLVDDGTLTQEAADSVAETLAGSDVLAGRGHHGARGTGGVSLDAAAEALDLTTEELRAELEQGSTLADVAETQGVETAAVVDALVEAASERLEAAVADGSLSQAEADERAAALEKRMTEAVEQGVAPGRRGGRSAPAPAGRGDGGTTEAPEGLDGPTAGSTSGASFEQSAGDTV
ncbi:hypothetical protein [Georgenia wangjunii]|uniref:hypothetical protein n=1 Tax=Georgenia wangjunii TaxID=3117730 RepID=UPI002F260AFD